MSGWGCPHEDKNVCTRLGGLDCDPGRKGCVLHGRFRFANESKNPPSRTPTPQTDPDGPAPIPGLDNQDDDQP